MRYDDYGPAAHIHTLLTKFNLTCMTSGRHSVFNVMGLALMGILMLDIKLKVVEDMDKNEETLEKVF